MPIISASGGGGGKIDHLQYVSDNGKVYAIFTNGEADEVSDLCSYSISGNNMIASYTPISGKDTYTCTVGASRAPFDQASELVFKNMVSLADAGSINITDYWSVGDSRSIRLSKMEDTGVGEVHAAQDAEIVLMNAGPSSGIVAADSSKPIHFIVGLRNCLNEEGYMDPSGVNPVSWDECARRKWCNNIFYQSLPKYIRDVARPFKVLTAAKETNSSSNVWSTDYASLFAEREIFGSRHYNSNQTEYDNLSQIKYYETSVNRIKYRGTSASIWWERSRSRTGFFCFVRADGSASEANANNTLGLAPFFCI